MFIGNFKRANRFADGSFSNAAGTMSYKIYKSGNAAGRRAALVVMLHGCRQTPEDFAAGTRMNLLAKRHGLIVLYPAQSERANPMNCWNWFEAKDQVRDQGEPGLIAALTRRVTLDHEIDERRIFVAGMSAGGAMAVILGAAYPDLFAAVGVHSGLPYRAARDASTALSAMRGPAGEDAVGGTHTPHAAPTIVFHGDCDTTVDPSNGSAIVNQTVATAANPAVPVEKAVQKRVSAGGRPYTITSYRRPNEPPLAEYWIVHGAGHAWSGGSPLGSFTDAAGPDASAEMVRFFLAQGGANPWHV